MFRIPQLYIKKSLDVILLPNSNFSAFSYDTKSIAKLDHDMYTVHSFNIIYTIHYVVLEIFEEVHRYVFKYSVMLAISLFNPCLLTRLRFLLSTEIYLMAVLHKKTRSKETAQDHLVYSRQLLIRSIPDPPYSHLSYF